MESQIAFFAGTQIKQACQFERTAITSGSFFALSAAAVSVTLPAKMASIVTTSIISASFMDQAAPIGHDTQAYTGLHLLVDSLDVAVGVSK